MFAPDRLTGVFFPIEAFQRDEPTMRGQERLARLAEELTFATLWTRVNSFSVADVVACRCATRSMSNNDDVSKWRSCDE